jgi:hypothetical protein
VHAAVDIPIVEIFRLKCEGFARSDLKAITFVVGYISQISFVGRSEHQIVNPLFEIENLRFQVGRKISPD